jgi:glycosyltransferase involved in cell wall biosynthesis
MRILILNWRDPKNPKSGGAEIVTLKHAVEWTKAGYHVVWLTSTFPGSTPVEYIDGVKIVRRWGSLSVYLYAPIYWFFNHKHFDLIIDQVHGIPFFTPLYTKKPIIVLIHEVAGVIWDWMYPFPVNIIGKMIEKIYLKLYRSKQFWTDAPSTALELGIHGIPTKNIIVIKPAVENVPFPKYKKESLPTFIYVNRLVRMKGIEEVIKAFSLICQYIPKSRLWIVGPGENNYLKILIQLVNSLGIGKSVIFWGKISETKKYELMNKSHILLHASVKEGWGLVVIEASSQGTPTVAYNVSGLCDSIISNKTGILLNKNNYHELAKEAISLFKDHIRYRNISNNCRKFYQINTWENATRQSLKLINLVLTVQK